MDSQQKKEQGPRCYMGSIMALSMLATAAATSIVVLTASWGNSGIAGETSIIIQSCTSSYFTQKYGDLNKINRITFVASSLAALISLQLAITVSGWFCKVCSKQKYSSVPRGKMFFWSSCLTLSAIPPLGYYFSFFIEANNCTNSVNFTEIIIILGIAAVLICLSITLSLLVLCRNPPQSSQKKYRIVDTFQTDANEEVKAVVHDWKIDLKKNNQIFQNRKQENPSYQKRQRPIDLTKQAIFEDNYENESPRRRPLPQLRQRQIYEPQQSYSPINERRQRYKTDQVLQHSSNRKPQINVQQKILQNLHPRFMNIDPRQYIQDQNTKGKRQNNIQDEFFKQQQRYLQNANQNILPRGGLRQRDNIYHENIQRKRQEKLQYNNYAVDYHPNEKRRYYSPERTRNNDFNTRERGQKISHGNQHSYSSFPSQHIYENDYPIPIERKPQFQRGYNSRDYESQQQSFQFHDDRLPRRHQYR